MLDMPNTNRTYLASDLEAAVRTWIRCGKTGDIRDLPLLAADIARALNRLEVHDAEVRAENEARETAQRDAEARDDERKAHNQRILDEHFEKLCKLVRANARHLTDYELGGSCCSRKGGIEKLVYGFLGTSDYRHWATRLTEPDMAEVARKLQSLRFAQSRGKFGPIAPEDRAIIIEKLEKSTAALAKAEAAFEAVRRENRACETMVGKLHNSWSYCRDCNDRVYDVNNKQLWPAQREHEYCSALAAAAGLGT